jgi:dihydrodipicolinate synthase/N-acetylneuraminate lyase
MVPYYYLAGAVGFTTGMANLTLSLSIRLHNDAIRERMKQAVALKDKFETLTSLRQEMGTPIVKAGLEMMGLAGGPVRSRGARPDTKDRRRVRKMLKQKSIL